MDGMTLAEVFENMVGPDAPMEFRAYDGSTSGTAGAPVRITVRSPVVRWASIRATLKRASRGGRSWLAFELFDQGEQYARKTES